MTNRVFFLKQGNLLRDVLYYTHPGSGASVEKAQGVVVGAVSALMASTGADFDTTWQLVQANLPEGYRPDAIPSAFRQTEV